MLLRGVCHSTRMRKLRTHLSAIVNFHRQQRRLPGSRYRVADGNRNVVVKRQGYVHSGARTSSAAELHPSNMCQLAWYEFGSEMQDTRDVYVRWGFYKRRRIALAHRSEP